MKSAILLFLDQPLPVLSQLAPGQSPDPLALALVRDTLRNLADVEADVFVFLTPDQDKNQARAILGKDGFKLANALGRNLQVQQRNAFRLVFARGYERAILLSNAMPDLPGFTVQAALDSLGWKCCCLGPVPGPQDTGGSPDQLYALGFDFEGYTTDALDMVDHERPNVFGRLETLLLFYERKVKVLAPYSPVSTLDSIPALVERCKDTRFALLPSLRLAAERADS
ncbi:MAG: hypothetical protein Q8O35_11355 [Humidesulfovibrio sp.]|jgi:hypothetical protein|uniref:DUF2064 domain-containing protein n=1 Tax=Humidesulfovibrio sp. TaxID=2910988 RepID=UPI00273237AC|nr:DUF2064 domain-containing protein [Humidesulfovibrio sp.]MDP2848769.1 hypothetical protein [Humidesulfovibrio sp.]